MNKHRKTALDTFEYFVTAAADDDIRHQVLLETTKAIFSPQVSGYLSKEPDPSPTHTVVEMIRGAGDR